MELSRWRELGYALAGIVVGWGISHYYYVESGKDLEKEAAELRRLNNIMLIGMEQAGWLKLSRDSEGRITGMLVELTGRSSIETGGAAGLSVAKPKH